MNSIITISFLYISLYLSNVALHKTTTHYTTPFDVYDVCDAQHMYCEWFGLEETDGDKDETKTFSDQFYFIIVHVYVSVSSVAVDYGKYG